MRAVFITPSARTLLLLIAAGWLASACQPGSDDPAAALTTVPGADLERGRRLMSHYQCGSCHRIDGEFAAQGQLGPPLGGFGRRSYIAGELPNTAALMQQWLLDPPALLPGTTMPRLGLSAADARDIAGYLLSLK